MTNYWIKNLKNSPSVVLYTQVFHSNPLLILSAKESADTPNFRSLISSNSLALNTKKRFPNPALTQLASFLWKQIILIVNNQFCNSSMTITTYLYFQKNPEQIKANIEKLFVYPLLTEWGKCPTQDIFINNFSINFSWKCNCLQLIFF